MHVTAVSNAIKKRGHLEDYEKAAWKYGKAKEAIESARAGLLLMEESMRKSRKEKDQGRREGGSSKGNVPCVLNQEFLFFSSGVLGFRSDPFWLKYWLLQD
jgi:hypothetical protein